MGVRTVAAAVLGFCTLVLGSAAPLGAATVDEAYRLFYASRFEESAAAAAELTTANPGDLVAWEIRTSALHFQLKRLVGEGKDKKGAFARCADCPKLLATFIEDVKLPRMPVTTTSSSVVVSCAAALTRPGESTAVPRINEMARPSGERGNARSFTAIPP